MKIKFDASQQYQLDAIQSVVNLFNGQPMAGQEFRINSVFGSLSMPHSALGFGNRLILSDAKLLENLHAVQAKNGLNLSEKLLGESVEYDAQNLEYRLTSNARENGWCVPHFSVEMETGTGKTYVYLRSIFELHKNYGFTKFIIVVPTVAIREGVKASIDLTAEHFKTLYDNTPLNHWIYDSKYASRLRDYAASNQIQILIINIDAFNKKDIAVIHNERDQTSGRKPIEFIQACNPIVIIDEPQNMESEIARRAITSLNPLCTLRYSATHLNPYNVVYRLGPVKAYDLGLVKRIEVNSILEESNFSKPFIHVQSIQNTSKNKIVAKLIVDVEEKLGPQRKTIKVEKRGDDLHQLTKREAYKGYFVEEIRTDYKIISFSNGVTLTEGQIHGERIDDRLRIQIKETVKEHFEKELYISKLSESQRLKVLSLFFIDRVSNYRLDNGGKGKIALWFEEAYEELRHHDRYKFLDLPSVDKVHDGYFAQDKKGNYKDSRETTENQEDRDTYVVIMKDKMRLLSFAEPLKFIFSHSALREGWDNPNVFQICTLNETRSEFKKRQEIGRGLRLPVRVNGERCFDNVINRLTVIANESYDDFARNLQTEIEKETGEKFEGRIRNVRSRRRVQLKKGWRLDQNFVEIWNRIKHKTRYAVRYSTEELIEKSAKELSKSKPISTPKFTIRKSEIITTKSGLETELRSAREEFIEYFHTQVPDLIGYLQSKTELTRGTLAKIIIESGRISEIHKNPQKFLEQALEAIQRTLRKLMVDGIKYEKIDGDEYAMMLFEEHYEHKEIYSYLDRLIAVDHSIVNYLEYESEIEKNFAEALDKRSDIKLFFKLPRWFFVKTPLGNYNPDWAIVKEEQGKFFKLYLVRETKGKTSKSELRSSEEMKIDCGSAHFKELNVDFGWIENAEQI